MDCHFSLICAVQYLHVNFVTMNFHPIPFCNNKFPFLILTEIWNPITAVKIFLLRILVSS